MEDVHDHISPAIQQNNVSSNEHVRAFRRWRRQPPPCAGSTYKSKVLSQTLYLFPAASSVQ